ncbi:hypothetical protein [Polynucleobacter sp. AP-Nino-20-G2]|uniref:hypothetical protein n=1 Tax=Polynucleobacter sp. AP-Nino-20-G2 TaxID=2576917 RepID=UPI001BFE9A74|nr:hypothetical protein [Polynucleobacter sp. AP-Nino-20-G2]QWE16745.1 hypothetical protein FD960_00490 [Polynucleobacter sp. AP-Nino-20-G2]
MAKPFPTPISTSPDRFCYPQGEQCGMPSRQISSQSFDDILSDLGDDPAIPDPHGIRKSSAPPRPHTEPHKRVEMQSFPSKNLQLHGLKILPLFAQGLVFLLISVALFFILESQKSQLDLEISGLQIQVSDLKKEMESKQLQNDSDREELYDEMDKLEVSIHSIALRPPAAIPQNKPASIPHETELRRWSYLGLARISGIEHGFFNTGKRRLSVSKGGLALGDWHLTQVDKEGVIFTHSKGKTIALKSTHSE